MASALWPALRSGAAAPVTALRRTAQDPHQTRVQLAWAAVMVASWTATVTVSVVAFSAGGSAAVAVAVLARSVPAAVAGLPIGVLVDRAGPSRCLCWAAALGSAAAAAAAGASSSLVAVVALVAVLNVLTMLFRTAQSAVLPALVDDPAELASANVVSSAVEAVGVFAGPALAALLLAVSGPALAFAVTASLYLSAALLLLGLRARAGATGISPAGGHGSTGGLLRQGVARLVLLVVLCQTLVSGGLLVLYPALAVDALELPASTVGLLSAAFGMGGVLGSLALFSLAGSSRLGALVAAALLLWAVPLLALPLAPGFAAVLVLLAVVGSGNVLFDVTCVTLLQRGVPARLRGRAFGALETVIVVGVGIGAVTAPVLDGLVGAASALALLGAPLLAVAALAWRPLGRLDRHLAPPARQVALLRALPPFALLPPPELERLALRLRRRQVPAQSVVAAQGDPGSTWFLVEAGELDVEVDGRQVRVMGSGEAFGEVALLRSGVRTATVTARTPTVLWALDGAVFLAALRADGGRALAAVDAVAQDRLDRAAPAASRRQDD